MNVLNLFGRLSRDPETKITTNGDKACYFHVAVSRGRRKTKDGKVIDQPLADFIPCVAYRKIGETIMEHMRKGDRIAIVGQLHSYTAKTPEGNRTRFICVVNKFDFGGNAKANMEMPAHPEQGDMDAPEPIPAEEISDEDIPF